MTGFLFSIFQEIVRAIFNSLGRSSKFYKKMQSILGTKVILIQNLLYQNIVLIDSASFKH